MLYSTAWHLGRQAQPAIMAKLLQDCAREKSSMPHHNAAAKGPDKSANVKVDEHTKSTKTWGGQKKDNTATELTSLCA